MSDISIRTPSVFHLPIEMPLFGAYLVRVMGDQLRHRSRPETCPEATHGVGVFPISGFYFSCTPAMSGGLGLSTKSMAEILVVA